MNIHERLVELKRKVTEWRNRMLGDSRIAGRAYDDDRFNVQLITEQLLDVYEALNTEIENLKKSREKQK